LKCKRSLLKIALILLYNMKDHLPFCNNMIKCKSLKSHGAYAFQGKKQEAKKTCDDINFF
jgi:hypothetical protein